MTGLVVFQARNDDMGLSLRVGKNRYSEWSYSGYGDFRKKIAAQVGIDLSQMKGFFVIDKSILSDQGWDAYVEAIQVAIEIDKSSDKISWDVINDPIKILLSHSDCEGEIPPEVCETLADRLEEIIKEWPERFKLKIDPVWQEKGYPSEMELAVHDTEQARGLIEGLREAARIGKPLEFS